MNVNALPVTSHLATNVSILTSANLTSVTPMHHAPIPWEVRHIPRETILECTTWPTPWAKSYTLMWTELDIMHYFRI